MRSLRKSWIGIILIFLFAISLFFWRQGAYISNIFNSDNVAAKVGNTPISTTKFVRTLEMNIRNFNQMLDKSLTGEEIINFQIHFLTDHAVLSGVFFPHPTFHSDWINFHLFLQFPILSQL